MDQKVPRKKLSCLKEFFGMKKKAEVDLRHLVLPIRVEEQDGTGVSHYTADRVMIDDVSAWEKSPRVIIPHTEYAMANGSIPEIHAGEISVAHRGIVAPDDFTMGVAPVLHLDLSAANYGTIDQANQTLELGSYPQEFISYIDWYYVMFMSKSYRTGKVYTGRLLGDGTYAQNVEYMCDGRKIVRVLNHQYNKYEFVRDDAKPGKLKRVKTGERKYYWYWVQPIKWKIRNWGQMPKQINPNGNGTASFMDVRSECALMGGIPYNPEIDYSEKALWSKNLIRGYLNGINIKQGKEKSILQGGFLHEAFDIPAELIQEMHAEALDTELNRHLASNSICNNRTYAVTNNNHQIDLEKQA